jgi:hypothetical protein
MPASQRLHIALRGTNAPGAVFEDRENVHVGMQRGKDVVELFPGDADDISWDFDVEVRERDGGAVFAGALVHGAGAERFVYLSWAGVDAAGAMTMFRRAKIMVSEIDPALVRSASDTGRTLVGSVGLTDGRGGPVSGAVREPAVTWSLGEPFA